MVKIKTYSDLITKENTSIPTDPLKLAKPLRKLRKKKPQL